MTLLLALVACVRFPLPYSASELAVEQRRVPRAVVHYLAQAEADVRVCALDRDGPVLPAADARVLETLRKAALKGRIPPSAAGGCWGGLLASHPESDGIAADLLDLAVVLVRKQPDHPVLPALVAAVLERPADTTVSAEQADRVCKALERVEHPLAVALVTDVELAAGRYGGQVVDLDLLMGLSEEELVRLARRLPDPDLRYQARALLVSLRIQHSPWAAVRAHSTSVQEAVLRDGHFAIPPASTVLAARWDPGGSGARVVRIQAEPSRSSARLVGARSEDREITAEPALELGGVRATVEGFEEAELGVCGDAFFDPSPCIPAAMLHLEDRYATLEGDRVVLATDLTLDDVVLLGRTGDVFAPPLRVGGAAVTDFAFAVHFDPVPSMRFGAGQDLAVDIYEISAGRLIVGVKYAGKPEIVASAVVPRTDATFRVLSIGAGGASGSAGSNGANGTTGMSGSPGSCYSPGGSGGNGGAGSPGGRGGNGGPGGKGGDILVTLHCDDCDALRGFALRQVKSVGGPGGPGGPGGQGGQGGQGGMGGSGGSCTETDYATGQTRYKTTPSGSSGSPGAKGADGAPGSPGPSGPPGDVVVRVKE